MQMFAPRRTLALVLVLVATAALAAGCGESKTEKAQKQVCNARADIKQQVDDLSSLTIATASVDGVKQNVKSIQSSLKQIADAQGTLSEDRRSQVQSATNAFKSEVTSIAQGLRSNLSLSEAGTKLKAAGQQLATSYQQSLGKIDCS
jgi:valyl-tRNA synthetase